MKRFIPSWLNGAGAGVLLAIFAVGFQAYFTFTTVHAQNTDGLGRILTRSPWLMRVILHTEERWPGTVWFVLDMIWFWSGVGLAVACFTAATNLKEGWFQGETERPSRIRTLSSLAVCVLATCGVYLGLHAAIQAGLDRGFGAKPSVTSALLHVLALEKNPGALTDYMKRNGIQDLEDPRMQSLLAQGIRRLSVKDLEVKARIQLRLLEITSTKDCARMARRDFAPEQAEAFFARLSAPEVEAIARVMAKALVAGAQSQELLPRPSPEEGQGKMDSLMEAIRASLSESERDRFSRTLRSFKSAPDEDVCWANQLFYRTALNIDSPTQREEALHAIALIEESGSGSN